MAQKRAGTLIYFNRGLEVLFIQDQPLFDYFDPPTHSHPYIKQDLLKDIWLEGRSESQIG